MEKILSTVSNIRKPRWFGLLQTPYSLIVTTERSIFAKVENKHMAPYLKKAREEAAQNGAGQISRIQYKTTDGKYSFTAPYDARGVFKKTYKTLVEVHA